jgi:hypothetical protein
MKEQKNSIGVRKGDNPPTPAIAHPSQNDLRHRFSELKNEIPFRLPSAAGLLICVLSYIGSLYSVTDCSVSYKYIKLLCLFVGI